MTRKILMLIVLLNFLQSATTVKGQGKPYKCTIKGEVFDRESEALLLFKFTDSRLNDKARTRIPITSKSFNYTFDVEQTEMYVLAFEDEWNRGAYDGIYFFPFNGVVHFVLYPQKESLRNNVCGGEDNREYYHNYWYPYNAAFIDRITYLRDLSKELRDSKQYYAAEYMAIIDQLTATKNKDSSQMLREQMMKLVDNKLDLSPAGRMLRLRFDTLQADQVEWRYNYAHKHTSLTSYYIMQYDLAFHGKDSIIMDKIIKTFPKFAIRYPKHNYTGNVDKKIKAWNTLVPGYRFVDMAISDMNGKMHVISKNIEGKIAVIDFWGSWCAPCIRKTQQIAPLYDAYKDKGFTIVGIAREFKDTTALKSRLSKENWDWLQLLDMDDKNQIWKRYGLPDGGGQLVLVDRSGKIISMNAKPEEVKAYLEKEIDGMN